MCRLALLFSLATCWLASADAQSNDNFAGRLTLNGASAVAVSNNLHATREPGEPNHAANAVGRSLWWTWTAPARGVVNFSTFSGGSGMTPPRALAVYTGGSLATLSEAASSNVLNAVYGQAAQAANLRATGASLNVAVTAGTIYQIAVDASTAFPETDDGTVVLSINAPPTILSAASVNAAVGTAFQYAILASNNPTVYGATNLPSGLSINPSNGVISGVPTANGAYTIGLSATGPGGTGTATLTIQVGDAVPAVAAAPVITGAAGASGVVGAAFADYLYASGSPTGYTVGALPDGLSFDATLGEIVGKPTVAGTFAVPVTATNATGTGSATLTLTIAATPPPPVITSALAVTATVGSASYYYIYTAGDGTNAKPTSYAASGLPPGLTLSTGSYVSGTPTQAGVYPATVSATNAGGTRTATVTYTVNAAATPAPTTRPPQLTSAALVTGTVGTTLSYRLTATNTPTGFAASNLPPGLALNTSTGAITGKPTAAGTSSPSVSATNANGTSTATLTFNIYATAAALADASGIVLPLITSPASACGYTGQSFSYTLAATYNGSPVLDSYGNWSFSASGLPPGLAISGASGFYNFNTITGTPTATGTYWVAVTANVSANTSYPARQAATATGIVTIIIRDGPVTAPVISGSASVTATKGNAFSYTPAATNSPTAYAASGLPPGLSINTTTGVVTGTPTTLGTSQATISATNRVGTGRNVVTFHVVGGTLPTSNGLATASGAVGTAFSYSLYANNQVTAYGASNLPPGLRCDASTGNISGTPTASGVYRVPVSITDPNGTTTATLTITVNATPYPAPVITSFGTALGTVGGSFSYAINTDVPATGYGAGSLPPGLSFNAAKGTIGGTPTTAGTYAVPISATNAAGTSNATLSVVIAPAPVPLLGGNAFVTATVNTAFSYTISASNAPTAYGASGLPGGLTLSTATGTITGTPTVAGTYTVPLSATNAAGTGTATLTLLVSTPSGQPSVVPSTPLTVACTVGDSVYTDLYLDTFNTTLTASGLPPGLGFFEYNEIGGVPTASGVYPVTLTATNAAGSASVVVTFIVATQTPPTLGSLPASASVLPGIRFWTIYYPLGSPTSLAASGLPPGLTLDGSFISGTPTTPGRYPVTISATNAAGTSSTFYVIVVKDLAAVPPMFTNDNLQATAVVGQAVGQAARGAYTPGTNGNGDPPLTLSFSGLPPGIATTSLSGNSYYFTGAPTAAGTYPATLTATNSTGASASEVITFLVIQSPPDVTSAAGTEGNVGSPLTYALASVNTNTSYINTITGYAASSLPPGLALDASTGLVSGTPTATGTYPATVTLTGPTGTGSAVITFVISGIAAGGLPVINSPAAALYQDILVTNTTRPAPPTGGVNYTVSAINAPTSFGASNLPAGLTINPYTGLISGQPLVSGTFQVPITATNAAGTSGATLTLTTTASLPALVAPLAAGGTVGAAFSTQIKTNATSYYGQAYAEQYELANDPLTLAATGLPPGLSLNSTTGFITGTPAQAGVFPVVISATTRAGTSTAVVTFNIAAVAPAPTVAPVLTSAAMAGGVAGLPLSYALAASGAASYAASNLPAGLSLNPGTGFITGTPTQPGTFVVPVSAANVVGTTQAALTIVADSAAPTPYITSAAAANAMVGTAFIYGVYTANVPGAPAVTTYGASNLPAGLSLNTRSGVITGTPTGPAGTFSIPLTASVGSVTGQATLTLVIQPAPSSASQPVLPNSAGALGFLDNPLVYALDNSGFVPTSALPGGLSFDSGTGLISGYPTAAGVYAISVAVPGGSGSTAVLTLSVREPAFSLPRLTRQPTGATVLQNGSVTLTAAAVGVPPPVYQWTHNGSPIPGATAATLPLSSAQPADTGSYVLTAANAAGQAVSVPVALTVQQTYATWQAAHFTAAEISAGSAADSGDFAGDGVPNLVKYALGIDPVTGAGGGLPVGSYSVTDGALQFGYMRDAARTDIDYVVEVSGDLRQWLAIASSTSGSPTTNLGGALAITEHLITGTSQVNVMVEDGQPASVSRQRFLRLKVVRP